MVLNYKYFVNNRNFPIKLVVNIAKSSYFGNVPGHYSAAKLMAFLITTKLFLNFIMILAFILAKNVTFHPSEWPKCALRMMTLTKTTQTIDCFYVFLKFGGIPVDYF